jgi:cyanate permease
VLGVNYLIAGILQAISPGLAGWTYDLTGSYRIAFISATLLSMVGALCTCLLRVPRPPGGIESMPG